jgi:hypothetical protein
MTRRWMWLEFQKHERDRLVTGLEKMVEALEMFVSYVSKIEVSREILIWYNFDEKILVR